MEENLEIIEVEGKEYAVCEALEIEDKTYWIISELLEDETPSEEVEVVRVEDGMLYGIEEEQEQERVKREIDKLLKEIEE